jgi:general secretion pathway protein G
MEHLGVSLGLHGTHWIRVGESDSTFGFEFAVESGAAHAEIACGAGLVPFYASDGVSDHIRTLPSDRTSCPPAIEVRDLIDEQCARELGRPFSVREESDREVLEFAHVPRPVVPLQERLQLDSRVRQHIHVPRTRAVALDEESQQFRNLMRSLAESREAHMHQPESREEVMQELLRCNEIGEHLIRCEYQSHIDRDVATSAKRAYHATIEHVQELSLDAKRCLGELVAEQRPAVRRFEGSSVTADRAGEGARHVTEQRRARERLVESTEIDGFEGATGARGVLVHEPRERRLAGAGGSEEHHRVLVERVAPQFSERIGERPGGRRVDLEVVERTRSHRWREPVGVPERRQLAEPQRVHRYNKPQPSTAGRTLSQNETPAFSYDMRGRHRIVTRPIRDSSRGFTLIEILVVVVIIAILATLVAPNVFQHVGTARETAARSQIEMLGAALDAFRLHVGRYPTTEEGLAALWERPLGGPSTWRGPYLRRTVPLDPWGTAYEYESLSASGSAGYRLISLGSDGRRGGSGDAADLSDGPITSPSTQDQR